ncbi:MAG: redoxin family protein [Gemmataceae bacterium]
MSIRMAGLGTLMAVGLAGCGSARPKPAAQETFANVCGGRYQLPEPGPTRPVVLLFLGHDCPISNAFAPELRRLSDAFTPQGVTFCMVYADADVSAADARQHATEYALPGVAILDPGLALARRYGASVKPEVVVLDGSAEPLYRGRIDDRYVDFGQKRDQPTTRDLHAALTAILAGRPVAVPRTSAIGCDIDFSPIPK